MKKSVKKRMIRGNAFFCVYAGVISFTLALWHERKIELFLLALACFCGAFLFYSQLKNTDWSQYEE